ncbi:RNA polymerase sigma factor, RpoD/SigA family [Microcoleus sp. S36b_A4]|uniref:RNA polymerase sigma factor, RpoD/SigA family n=2 Tax=Microcoleus TaxID=44471 RepID=UPI0040407040
MTPRINSGGKFLGYRFFISGRMNPGACILDAFDHGLLDGFRKFPVKLVKVKGYFSNPSTDTKHDMAESDLGSFAVAPEASFAIAQDEDTEIDRPTVTRSSAYNNWSADDPVGALFKEMARYPLLTAAEEVELARRVQELVALDELEQRLQQEFDRVPTKAEIAAALGISETQLQQLRHQCQSAKRKMISSNLRLVVSIAKRYLNRGVPFLDLIQEGALGLNRAAEKFDPEKGYKFSTYAYWWIRQGITRTIANQGRTIRLPVHIVEQLNKLKKVYRDLKRSLQRNPNETELAREMQVTCEQLRYLQQVRRQSLSLNHRIGSEESSELLDVLEDNATQSPEAQMNEMMMRQDILEVLDSILTEREKEIVAMRYGLLTGEPYTLEEVSSLFNLSRERVRQIQNKAMRKLRRPQVTERLKGWLK